MEIQYWENWLEKSQFKVTAKGRNKTLSWRNLTNHKCPATLPRPEVPESTTPWAGTFLGGGEKDTRN